QRCAGKDRQGVEDRSRPHHLERRWARSGTLVRIVLRGIHMIFHVTMEPAEDGWIVAECPALPGCVSQGRDEEEALRNIKEAITAWMWAEDQKAIQALPK